MLLQEGVGLQGEPPVADVGIGQHRAVGIGSGLGAAQIVIEVSNVVHLFSLHFCTYPKVRKFRVGFSVVIANRN